MIRLIEALNFRCLRHTSQALGPFHILVGPNASGKTTFLDVIGFLGRMVSDGVDAAVRYHTDNFEDILFARTGRFFELAIEARIPEAKRALPAKGHFDTIRYEVQIGMDEQGVVGILEERAVLKTARTKPPRPRELFPMEVPPPSTILEGKPRKNARTVLSKSFEGNDNFYSEVLEESGKGWFPSIRLGPKKSALGNLPEDETRFPISTWLKRLLTEGVQLFMLNSLLIRKASPPGQIRGFKPDGSNLPWVISDLKKKDEPRFRAWIRHIQTALPDIRDLQIIVREDDKHAYLVIHYEGGLKVPSWMASDGTLRLLALTLPAYLSDFKGVYLIEEPENGIHPGAVETVFQSLSSVYDAQILLATHSPIILSQAKASDVLCFKKTESGSTDIVMGNEHPHLKDWKGQPNLSVLFASGVLG
ncbi:MAG TPA: ATP-binding protein [Syntrophales bacterium]|nr:ATP-binding protein [Syntrophales bacterium]